MKLFRINSIAIPIRYLLVIPFAIQIFAAVGITGYLSLRHGRNAVEDLALQLEREASESIALHLDAYMSVQPALIQNTVDLFSLGLLDPENVEELGDLFWKNRQIYDIGFMMFGTASGYYADSGYDPSVGSDVISEISPKRRNSNQFVYKIDARGKRMQLAFPPDTYQFQEESWYPEAIRAGKPVWSSVYSWKINPFPLAIAYASPIYAGDGSLIGAIGVEQLLLQISDFLNETNISPNSRTFIIERDGMLIANSGQKLPFEIINNLPVRLNVMESDSLPIQAAANHLTERFGGFDKITASQQLSFTLDGQRNFMQVMLWGNDIGLDWLVVVVAPESDFMAQINANARLTVILCVLSLICALVLGFFTSRWISHPILRLGQATKAVSNGDLGQTVEPSAVRELSTLSRSFNRMAKQLRESFAELKETNENLEVRVEERTQTLSETLTVLKKTQAQLIQTEKMSSLGQLMAGVAHEINNPITFVYGNLEPAKEYTQDLILLIQSYQAEYPHPSPETQALIKQIDLAYLREDLPKVLDSMEMGTNRITEIVRSLRNFSRLDEAEFKKANIHQGIDSTLLILNGRIKEQSNRREIVVNKEYSDLPQIVCYPGQLNQVFMNILANAIDTLEEKIKLSEDNNWVPEIRIQTQPSDDNQISIRITDNGLGVPESIKKKIFDPFFTTKPVGKGTGLGMSISYQIIVEKHQGKLQCISTPGQGTEMLIEIPNTQS